MARMKDTGQRLPKAALALPYVALILLPLLAFLPVLFAQFVLWDDDVNVFLNPRLLASAVDPVYRWWTELDRPDQHLYVPLTYTIWWIISRFARLDAPRADGIDLDAGVFHAVNLLLHLGNGILVYWIIRRFIKRRWPAAVGALLFAVHPVVVEAVAWVTGLKDVLSGLLALVAIYGFVRFTEIAPAPAHRRAKGGDGSGGRWIWWALGFVAFALSMLAKPSTGSVPILAGVLGCAMVLRSETASIAWSADVRRVSRAVFSRVMVPLLPWLAATIAVGIESRHAQFVPLDGTSGTARPLIAADAVSFYIRVLFCPIHLAADYGRTPGFVAASAWRYVTWTLPVVILLLAFAARKRVPLLLAGVLLFMAAPLMVLGLVPFAFQVYSTVADRYLYLAMLGAALAAAALADRFWRPPVAIACAAVLLALAAGTFVQSTYWHDTSRLFTHTLAVNPRSFVAHSVFGYLAAKDGRDDEAVAQYEQAVRIRPTDYFANYNWGNLLLREGKPAEALARYREAMRSVPDDAPLQNNAGIALIKLGRPNEAIARFQQAVDDDPDFADAQCNLGRALRMQSRYAEAYKCFQRAVEIDSNQDFAKEAMAQLEARGISRP